MNAVSHSRAADLAPIHDKIAVLIVDDDAATATGLGRALARADYDVRVAFTGEEALRRLGEQHFDVLLAGVRLPGLDTSGVRGGDELQRRARRADPELVVLLLTGAHDVEGAVGCLRSGVADYVTKPFLLADVTVRIARALEQRQLAVERREQQRLLEQRAREQTERVGLLVQRTLQALVSALEAKDEGSRNHSSRVAHLSNRLAARLYPADGEDRLSFANQVRVAALFHDIGNIGVSDVILHKQGALTEEDQAAIRSHAVIGEEILRPLFPDPTLIGIVRHHHEQIDGGGYPDGLLGDAIPLGARILAVADSYDALTSSRPYRPGRPPAVALQILQGGAGRQWDAAVVAAFLALVREGEVEGADPADAGAVPPAAAAALAERFGERGQPVMRVETDLDEPARQKLRTEVGALIGRGETRFVVDLTDAGCVDSAALELLYLLHTRAEETGGRMVVRGALEHVRAALSRTDWGRRIHHEPAEAAAPDPAAMPTTPDLSAPDLPRTLSRYSLRDEWRPIGRPGADKSGADKSGAEKAARPRREPPR